MRAAQWALGLVLAYAALQRLVYLVVYSTRMPFFDHPLADARVYEAWSRVIVSGDLWSRAEGVFYRAPLYPYFLAAVRALTGETMPGLAAVQAILGLLLLYLTARLAARAAGPWAGVLAAALLALYGPLLALESKRLATTLGLALHVGSLWLILGLESRPSAKRGLLAGTVLGLSALVRPHWILLGPVLYWVLTRQRPRPSLARGGWGWVLCGLLLVLAPVTLRNRVIGGEWVLVSSNGGMTFYQGNNPENHSGLLASAPEVGLLGDAEGQRRTEREVAERLSGASLGSSGASRFWLGRGLEFVVRNPGNWLRLETKKVGLFVRNFEFADSYSFAAERSRVWPLWFSPLPFGILLCLGVLGSGVRGVGSAGRVAAVSAGWAFAGCLVFYVSSRYRVEAAPGLAVLGGVFLTRILGLGGTRGYPNRAAWVVAAIVGVASCWPVDARVRSQESMANVQLGSALAASGELLQAERAYEHAIELYPPNTAAWRRLLEQVARRAGPEESLARFAQLPLPTRGQPELQYVLGILHEATGDLPAAEGALRNALRGQPEFPEAKARLGGLRARLGAIAEAESLLAVSTTEGPAPASVWETLALLRLRLRDFSGADLAAGAALELDPTRRSAGLLRARSQLHLGATRAARQTLAALPQATGVGAPDQTEAALWLQVHYANGDYAVADSLGSNYPAPSASIRFYGTLAALRDSGSPDHWRRRWDVGDRAWTSLMALLETRALVAWGEALNADARDAWRQLDDGEPGLAAEIKALLLEETGGF